MARWGISCTVLAVAAVGAGGAVASAGEPSLVTTSVDTTRDSVDADVGDGRCADAWGDCSLRAAVQQANAVGGEHRIVLASHRRYGLTRAGAVENSGATGDLDVLTSMEVVGNGSTVDANRLDRAFDGHWPLVLRGLRVVDGRAPNVQGGPPTPEESAGETAVTESGGAIRSAWGLRLFDVVVRDSSALGGYAVGGAVSGRGAFAMHRVRLIGNSADRAGGGVAVFEPDGAVLEDVVARGNSADDGGGVYLYGAGYGHVRRARLVGNSAARYGGGLATLGGAEYFVSDSRIVGNRAGVAGGGIWAGALTHVERSRVVGNHAPVGPNVYP